MNEHSTQIVGIIKSCNAQLFESNNWVKSYFFRSISKTLNQINQSMNVHSFTTTMPNVTLISSLINSSQSAHLRQHMLYQIWITCRYIAPEHSESFYPTSSYWSCPTWSADLESSYCPSSLSCRTRYVCRGAARSRSSGFGTPHNYLPRPRTRIPAS